MKYRHGFHAGNFADVHKHVTLLALIAALQRKEKGFLYLETHAGRGRYELDGADSNQGAEARLGIGALQAASCNDPHIAAYLEIVTRFRLESGSQSAYPGSPVLAAFTLRPQDRGRCFEIQAPECRALERALHSWPRMSCVCGDGYEGLKSQLPPPERRALVCIDPPYEEQEQELTRGAAAIDTALARLANAVVMFWYPIKDERALGPWLQRLSGHLAVPALHAELWLHPRDSRVGLNGSGVLIVNPPYQLDVEMRQWLPQLGTALGADRQGGTRIEWLAHEQH